MRLFVPLPGRRTSLQQKGVALMQTLSPTYIASLNRMHYIWSFPHWRGTVLKVPKTRTIVFLDLYWSPPPYFGQLLKSLRLSPPTAGAQMVRAEGQGHGRNDAATTDPQPRALRDVSDACSRRRWGRGCHTRECFRYVFSRCCGGCGCSYWSVLWVFAVMRPAASRGPQQGLVVRRSPLTRCQ